MAIITPDLIGVLSTTYSTLFQQAIGATPTNWAQIATLIPSSTASNTYGWLGQFPKMREWIGARQAKDMEAKAYTIVNKTFEDTVEVKRTDIEDDNLGIYAPMLQELARAVKTLPDELVFALLAAGHTTLCYDDKMFFAADHPVYPNVDGTGTAMDVSNTTTGNQPAWYLLDTSRSLKPIIFQERTQPELTVITDANNSTVFNQDVYPYGARYRCNAGFGFWQMAHKSKAALDTDGFDAAFAAMQSIHGNGGRPLGITPTTLVVPPSLRAAANKVVKSQLIDGGDSNPNYNAVEVIVSPWLA
mgnify:CR=1 FL=1